ncbi:hypothetical protein JCM33374_g983 [Metschnikowia sp. JCM 33374]|nr:hypothetical protein JCM33374_g983 [Metschnikowia sp. JCM 33374]
MSSGTRNEPKEVKPVQEISSSNDRIIDEKSTQKEEEKTSSNTPNTSNTANTPDTPKNDPTEAPASTASPGMTWNDWKKLPLQFFMVYMVIFCMYLGFLSIYWGSLYHREDRVKNMKILIAIEDSPYQLSNSTDVDPSIGPRFKQLVDAHPNLGHFVFANTTELSQKAAEKNTTWLSVLEEDVHQNKYWAAIHVNSDTSANAYNLLLSGNTSSPSALGLGQSITALYETGRHYSALSMYVTKSINALSDSWISTYAPSAYASMVKTHLTPQQQQNLVSSANSSSTGASFSFLPSFKLVDMRPAKSTVVLGPSEIGLVYAQIFSFHQFNFSADLHSSVRETLRFRHYLFYRVMFSQLNHIILALVYGLMTIAFRVPTDVAYGKAGFLVLWAVLYLFMSASGGLNECVCTIIMFYKKTYLLPPWIIGMVVVNIAPTFAPYVLTPGFYRYGYTMPMFHAYEALKVVFFDTWKGTLGLNYGILVAWVVVTNIVLCFLLKYISKKTKENQLNELSKL